MQRIGVYPGTFDPITTGHLDIIKRALKLVDHLIVGVAVENSKSPLFSIDERMELVSRSVEQAVVSVKQIDGLLVDFCQAQQANIIIRGLRAVSDFEFEFQLSCLNNRLAPELQTIFIPASETTQFISSRLVREVARLHGDVSSFVPLIVGKALAQRFTPGTKKS